jgi:hypothetical protein
MKAINLFYVALISAFVGLSGPASAEDSAAVTNYKKEVTRIVDTWGRNMTRANDDLVKAKADLAALDARNPRPADYEKQAAALRTKMTNARATMEFANNEARIALGLLEFKPAKKDEGIPLPAFVKSIIAAKGIPLNKTVSVAPDASWNWKSNTLGTLGVNFNFKFKNF